MKRIKINIPNVTISIQKNEQVITEFEPKNGDIVVLNSERINKRIGILYSKHGNDYVLIASVSIDGFLRTPDAICTEEKPRPATDGEKLCLMYAIAKRGLHWNEEKNRVEDLPRWRAKNGEMYCFILSNTGIAKSNDTGSRTDDELHSIGNYFKTYEAAERAAKQIREIFKNSKEE